MFNCIIYTGKLLENIHSQETLSISPPLDSSSRPEGPPEWPIPRDVYMSWLILSRLLGVGGARGANTAGDLATLALTPGVSSAIVDVGPGSVLARSKEGCGRGSRLIGAQGVDAGTGGGVIVLIIMTNKLVNSGNFGHGRVLTAQVFRSQRFLLQPETTDPLQEQVMHMEKPLL